jgi:hypothetical protein
MKKTFQITGLVLAALLTVLVGFGQTSSTPDFTQPLSIEEIGHLTYMVEEEKLARDVYESLYEEWGNRVFRNIAQAEQRHMDSVLYVMETYGLNVELGEIGQFTDPDLAVAYGQLMAAGTESELKALSTGALIEEIDINDLVLALNDTVNPVVQAVFENLMRGSRNHLRAFAGQIETQGVEYMAQHMGQEDVDAILDSPRERGGRRDCVNCGLNGGAGNGPKGSGKGGFGGNGPGSGMGTGTGMGPGDGTCLLP